VLGVVLNDWFSNLLVGLSWLFNHTLQVVAANIQRASAGLQNKKLKRGYENDVSTTLGAVVCDWTVCFERELVGSVGGVF
jgi:hypothetical protein